MSTGTLLDVGRQAVMCLLLRSTDLFNFTAIEKSVKSGLVCNFLKNGLAALYFYWYIGNR